MYLSLHNIVTISFQVTLLCSSVHIELFIQVFVMQNMLNAINNTEEEEELYIICVTVTYRTLWFLVLFIV